MARPVARRRIEHRGGPAAAVMAVGALAAVLSCWPVVFAGRSFVSPLNGGVDLLYAAPPFVPGYAAAPVADVAGADVGAINWAMIPYSVLQHQAMVHGHRLPLWNRFAACGAPLLGQGVSMLGDPLSWLPILAGGAAWAWDAKFVLAKMLFAAGAGLVALEAAGHPVAAALVGASAAWTGFFAYRFNHPAFFSLCYAPWILVGWGRLARARSAAAAVPAVAVLMAAAWMELNSGTVREAVFLLLSLNAAGAAWLLASPGSWRRRLGRLGMAAAGGAVGVMLSAPVWLTFLDTLRSAWTAHAVPGVYQLHPALLLGHFDDLFLRRVTRTGQVSNPSSNLLMLAGVLWCIAGALRGRASRSAVVLGLAAMAPCALAFGWIPGDILRSVPALGRFAALDNHGSLALMVLLLVPAAEGWRLCLTARRAEWRATAPLALLGGGLLVWGYVAGFARARAAMSPLSLRMVGPDAGGSGWFLFEAAVLAAAAPALPYVLWRAAGTGRSWLTGAACAIALVAVHARHGMVAREVPGAGVMAPQRRMDRMGPSPALAAVQAELAVAPGRAVGFLGAAFPGYLAQRGIEGIWSADPLVDARYRELEAAIGAEMLWEWRMIVRPEAVAAVRPVLDALNVRIYLGMPDGARQPALPGLIRVGRLDLDVYRSATAWPRAFWTDRIVPCDSAAAYVSRLRSGDGQPFAAVPSEGMARAPDRPAAGSFRAAGDFQLETDRTSFLVKAPGPGWVVLLETCAEGCSSAIMNDHPAPMIRVNHAFQGLRVPAAGEYRITVRYRPRRFTLALALAGCGVIAGAALWWWLRRGLR